MAIHYPFVVAGACTTVVEGTAGAGAVFLFEILSNDTLAHRDRIVNPFPTGNERFGDSVSIFSRTVAVGVPEDGALLVWRGGVFFIVVCVFCQPPPPTPFFLTPFLLDDEQSLLRVGRFTCIASMTRRSLSLAVGLRSRCQRSRTGLGSPRLCGATLLSLELPKTTVRRRVALKWWQVSFFGNGSAWPQCRRDRVAL